MQKTQLMKVLIFRHDDILVLARVLPYIMVASLRQTHISDVS